MKFKYLLIGLIFVLFAISATTLSRQTEAQLSGFGSACVNQTADCSGLPVPPGGGSSFANLSETISEGSIRFHGLTSSRFQDTIDRDIQRSEYPGSRKPNYEELCFSTQYTDIIQVVMTKGQGAESNMDLPSYNDLPGYHRVARACELGTVPKKMETTLSQGLPGLAPNIEPYWNCCPGADYAFVPGTNRGLSQLNPGLGACCRIPTGASPGDPDYPAAVLSDKCYNAERTPGEIAGSTFTNPFNYGKNVGIPLGLTPLVFGVIEADIQPTAGKVCPLNGGCALVPSKNQQGVFGDLVQTENGSFYVVTSESMETNASSNLQCNGCFAKGEPMLIEPPNDRNGNKSKLVLCDAGGTDHADGLNIRKTDLINNSVSDTIAYLTADGPENQQYILECRTKGGIPTAIGCIDFTPLGIITGLIRLALGVVGGVALIQLIIIGIQYQRGDETKIKEARDRLIATLTGVAVLIFSVLILRILGVNILDVIPAGTI